MSTCNHRRLQDRAWLGPIKNWVSPPISPTIKQPRKKTKQNNQEKSDSAVTTAAMTTAAVLRSVRELVSPYVTYSALTDGTREKRQAQPPRILQEFIVEAPVERTPVTTPDALRTHCYYPVIDRLVSEMRRHFSTEAGGVLTGVSAISPKHASFLDKKCLQPMAQFYGVTEENLTAELHQVRRLLERKKAHGHVVNDTVGFLTLMRPYQDAFVDLYRLICISLTLPVVTPR